MSDLRRHLRALARASPNSRFRSYFDAGALRPRAGHASSPRGPRYLGHELAVPELGDYHALPQEGEGRALVRTPEGRRADLQRLPPSPGADAARPRHTTGGNIVCPLHRWTYDLDGRADRRAALRATTPACNLHNYPLPDLERPAVRERRTTAATSPPTWPASARAPTSTSPATCSTASSCTSATTTGRPSSRSTSRTTTSARSTPGSASFVTCDDLRWEFGRHHSVQTVGVDERARPRRASPVYRKWHDAAAASTATASRRKHGAIWLTYYPAT